MDPRTSPVQPKSRYLDRERRRRLSPAGSAFRLVSVPFVLADRFYRPSESRYREGGTRGGTEAARGERRGGAPLPGCPPGAADIPSRLPPSPVLPPLSLQPQHKLPEPAASRARCRPKELFSGPPRPVPGLPRPIGVARGSAGFGLTRLPPEGLGSSRVAATATPLS